MTIKIKTGKYLKQIPRNARIAKTYTGIGGTTAEITAHRNSIIFMPAFRAVQQKTTVQSDLYNVDDIFGVYGGHNETSMLIDYVNSDVKYKKIVMTMSRKSVTVLQKAIESNPEIYGYNLLLDEVDQIQDDSSFREDLALCYDLLSVWKQKAYTDKTGGTVSVISATGVDLISFEPIAKLPLYRVETQKSRNTCETNIISTSEVEATAASLINASNNRMFIFYNNVDGSKRIINALNIKNKSKIYCGTGSENKAKEFYSNDLDAPQKYNFFTRAYFRAIDIRKDGEIIIITNPNSMHSGLTVEDICQSAGRIRNTIKKITIIMDTKDNKSKLKDMPVDKVVQFFRDIANKQLGMVESLDTMGELTDRFYEGCGGVRRNLRGNFAINYGWIEHKVKRVLVDNKAYESVKNMQTALKAYEINAVEIKNSAITCKVQTEKQDWAKTIEFVIETLAKDEIVSIFLRGKYSDNELLIIDGLKKLPIDTVVNTKSKNELRELIDEFDTKDRLAIVGYNIGKKLGGNRRITSREAKELMKDIYKLKGYAKRVKASDLKMFFNDVEPTIWKVSGKVIRGYNIGTAKYSEPVINK